MRWLRFRPALVDVPDRARFQRVVRGIFTMRRKTLLNALKPVTGWETLRIRELLESLGIDPERRPQTLTLDEVGNPTKVTELSAGDDHNLAVSGLVAIIDSQESGTPDRDLYMTTRPSIGAAWSPLIHLDEVDTAIQDGSPFLTDDHHHLYFHRFAPYQMCLIAILRPQSAPPPISWMPSASALIPKACATRRDAWPRPTPSCGTSARSSTPTRGADSGSRAVTRTSTRWDATSSR